MTHKNEIEHHDKLAERLFALSEKEFRKDELKFLNDSKDFIMSFGDVSGKRLLDCGCGVGLLACYFASQGAEVFAFDISPEMVKVASRRACLWHVDDRVHLKSGSFEEIDYDAGHFDIVYGNMILHHVDIERSMEKIMQLLHKRGKAIFRETSSENPLLMFLRKNIAGRFGIQRRSSPDEYPLSEKVFSQLSLQSGNVRLHYPEMFLWRLLARTFSNPLMKLLPQGLKDAAYNACLILDRCTHTLFPFLRKYSYYCYIEAQKNG